MSRRTRRIIAVVGGGLGVFALGSTAGLAGLMYGEVKLAEKRIPQAFDDPPASNGTVWAAPGVDREAPPIRMAMVGDSTAAGYGVHRDRDTPGAQTALCISGVARRPVHLSNVAVVGAESPDLGVQVDALERRRQPLELTIVIVGANDVTENTKPAEAVPYLADAVARLRALGSEVVVGTCPDLGTIRPLAQPLRAWARRQSRKLARAQTVAVVGAGGRTISLGDLIGPSFAADAGMFSADRFHPSAAGYAEAARAMLPSCLDALGLRTSARSASAFTTRRVKPVAKAAAQAAARPGAEVAPGERFGRGENRRGPLAQLRRRRPHRRLRKAIRKAIPT